MPAGEGVERRFVPVLVQSALVLAAAVVAFLLCRHAGIAKDCGAGSHAGQCGLASAMGVMFGVLAAVTVFGAGMILVLVREIHARKRLSRQG